LNQLKFFFENYKALEPGKWVKFEGWAGVDEACDAILQAVAAFSKDA
jgi:inorganic pyrophosphatase